MTDTPEFTFTRSKQISLFEGQRMSFREAIDLSVLSLCSYGEKYSTWSVSFSGGKDSSATASFVLWAIRNKLVPAPKKLYVLYADTRMELPPLSSVAQRFLQALRDEGVDARTVVAEMDHRFMVYMLGRGVPPPSNSMRWCTEHIKVQPMMNELATVHDEQGEKFLSLTGLRKGESANRDARIAIACSTKDGECGQGYFQAKPSEHAADSLAPIVHWRACNVWDWLYDGWSDRYMSFLGYTGLSGHTYDYLGEIAAAYGDDEARTGCAGCALVEEDVALENCILHPDWGHLAPLRELKPLYRELREPRNRLRKLNPEVLKKGNLSESGQRMGPLTMEARSYGLDRVLDIQRRASVDFINAEEEARIREMWALNIWPQKWEGGLDDPNNVRADAVIPKIVVSNQIVITQNLLV